MFVRSKVCNNLSITECPRTLFQFSILLLIYKWISFLGHAVTIIYNLDTLIELKNVLFIIEIRFWHRFPFGFGSKSCTRRNHCIYIKLQLRIRCARSENIGTLICLGHLFTSTADEKNWWIWIRASTTKKWFRMLNHVKFTNKLLVRL